MPCPIDWCSFSWTAFATLATGFAAVGGAIYVGGKQARISRQQAQILAQQASVARIKLRSDLFDRRFKVYEAIKVYLHDAMALRVDFDPHLEKWATMKEQLEQARFLFAGPLQNRFMELWDEADDLLATREKLRDARKAEKGEVQELEQAVRDKKGQLRSRLTTLAEDMGEEMQLYLPEPSG